MRRVAITGLGAVTPIGLDAQTTWESAVAGRSGVGFIETFDASGFPVRIAAEVKGFDPETVAPPKEVRRMERNVLIAVAAAQQAWSEAAVEGVDASRVGVVVGSAIGGIPGIAERTSMRARGVAPGMAFPRLLSSQISYRMASSAGDPGTNRREYARSG